MATRAKRFPLLDPLRALAILIVVLAHVATPAGALDGDAAVRPLIARFEVGVTIFFMISALLVYRPFVRARLAGEPPPSLRSYALGRFLRIVPAYWVALTVIAIWLGYSYVFSFEGVLTYYGFAQTYAGKWDHGIPAAWFLCVLVSFYLFLPLYAAAMRRLPGRDRRARLRGELWGLAMLVGAGLLYKAALLAGGLNDDQRFFLTLPAFIDWLALGMGLALASVVLEQRSLPRLLRPLDRGTFAAWGPAVAIFVVAALGTGLDEYVHFQAADAGILYGRHAFDAVFALLLILPAVFGDMSAGWGRRFLSARWLVLFGLISYGVFLYHQAVLTQLGRWGLDDLGLHSYLVWPLAVLAGASLLGFASYRLVERPALRLRRRLDRPRAAPPAGEGESVAGGVPVAHPR